MNTSLLLAITFFASIDTAAALPAPKSIDAIMKHCEASNPESTTIALQDGKRFIVFQSPEMAVEIHASRRPRTTGAANVVGRLASALAGRKVA